MRIARVVAIAIVAGSALLAYAQVGNGDIRPVEDVAVATVTSTSTGGSATATLQNTTAMTTYSVRIGSDATCDPDMGFTVAGGNPIASFAPQTSRNVTVTCPPRGSDAMHRCLYHATNNLNDAPLADFMGVCLYGSSTPSLTPLTTTLDFGTVDVGDAAEQTLEIRNDAAAGAITRVYLQTSDAAGNFQFGAPCNPDGAFCDEDLAAAAGPGGTFAVDIKCRPQSAGAHTAQLYVGTNTFQLMSLGVTLQCTGAPTTVAALGINPPTIRIPAPLEVIDDTASVVVHLENPGGTPLVITDVRTVDVDTGAAADWSYVASGACSGQISTMCNLASGGKVDINLTFDPSEIGSRRAALLVSYRDTIDRTAEIPLDATGQGATLRMLDPPNQLTFGTVPVGGSSQLDVTLFNEGNRDTTAMLTGAMPPFTFAPATMAVVSPATRRTVTVTCTPTAEGSFTTTLVAQASDVVQSSPIMRAISCEGSSGLLYANPTSLQLDEIRLDAGTLVHTVQVLSTNTGMPLTLVGQPALESANTTITLGGYSQTTTPATFDVMLAPTTTGTVTNAIIVTTSNGETLRIPIVATAVRASYLVAPTLDLGTFCVDQPTASSTVALASDGNATIELMAPTLGQSPSPFELAYITPPLYPNPLTAATTAVVAVTPKRQQTATTVSDTLTWRTDVAAQPTAATNLTARFISSGGAIAPSALSFGEVTVHLFSDNGQRVVIQNCNTTPLVLDPPMIRTPFSIDSPNFPAMLNPNESVAFSVGFHPTRVGPVAETLRITSPQLPGAPLEVMLFGEGGTGNVVTPDAGVGSETPDDTSFYACDCSTSRPLGALPIALALFGILRRRRR